MSGGGRVRRGWGLRGQASSFRQGTVGVGWGDAQKVSDSERAMGSSKLEDPGYRCTLEEEGTYPRSLGRTFFRAHAPHPGSPQNGQLHPRQSGCSEEGEVPGAWSPAASSFGGFGDGALVRNTSPPRGL